MGSSVPSASLSAIAILLYSAVCKASIVPSRHLLAALHFPIPQATYACAIAIRLRCGDVNDESSPSARSHGKSALLVILAMLVVPILCTCAVLASMAAGRSNARRLSAQVVTTLGLVVVNLDRIGRTPPLDGKRPTEGKDHAG